MADARLRWLGLQPGQLGRFLTSGFGQLRSGWGAIRASAPVGIQVNLSRLIMPPRAHYLTPASRASYPPSEPRTRFRTFQEFDFGFGDNDVGLAILNPAESEEATVRIALVKTDGRH